MKLIKKLTAAVLAIAAICAVLVFGIDFYVKQKAKPYMLTPEEAGEGYDCVLVLGCGVWGDTPSHMLEDRLLEGISLCQSGAYYRPVAKRLGSRNFNSSI